MEERASEHPPGTSTDDRLKAVINEFHSSHGLAAKHRLDEDKRRSVYNIIAGTCPDLWLYLLFIYIYTLKKVTNL